MEIYEFVKKMTDAILSGKPVAVFEKETEKLNVWIIIKKLQISDSGLVGLEDENGDMWFAHEWNIVTLDEYYDMIRP